LIKNVKAINIKFNLIKNIKIIKDYFNINFMIKWEFAELNIEFIESGVKFIELVVNSLEFERELYLSAQYILIYYIL